MSSYIMNNMVYDTKKAEKICEGSMMEPLIWFGRETGCKVSTRIILYKTKKGNYFCTHPGNYDKASVLNEDEAKEIMRQYAYDYYCKLYGELPEA